MFKGLDEEAAALIVIFAVVPLVLLAFILLLRWVKPV